MTSADSTIAAVATPPGSGGVGIVRLSGPEAERIGQELFRASNPEFHGFEPRFLHHGYLHDPEGAPIDECLAVLMPGPNSYTGEDVLEFHCHGGRAVLAAALSAVLAAGAEPAPPGEFTKRAFLSGRMDLSRAEAVAELIAAPSRASLAMAGEKLAGALAEKVRELRRALEELRAGLCLALDFPEEEVECLSPQELRAGIERTAGQIRELLAAYRRAAPWRQGLLAVLAGRVNAGKSSLMNALLGRERAIVTELPGTTRDYLEESVDLDGLPVRLVDTAGLRDAGDAVELAGVERSRELIEKADLVLLVAERNLPPDKLDLRLANELGPAKTLVALNKSDLEPADDDPAERFTELGFETLALSAATGEGLDELAARILARVPEVETDSFGPAPNERQARNLEQALAELEALLEDLAAEAPYDLLGVRLETATTRLAEITGDITSDEILNSIFERFCIGK